jgi:hypothetical protein
LRALESQITDAAEDKIERFLVHEE